MIHAARQLYDALPESLRALAGIGVRHLPVGLRYGGEYLRADHEARGVDVMDRESMDAAVDSRLRTQMSALAASPWCREALRGAGMRAEDVTARDLPLLPTCSKSDLREHPAMFMVPEDRRRPRKWVTTSGSSGEPFGFWLDKDASIRDWAYTVHAWKRVGYRLDASRVVFRGVVVDKGLFRYEPIRRELYVSVFKMDDSHLPTIRAKIREYRPEFLHGYPSALDALAASYDASGETPPTVTAVFLVSETVTSAQRQRIERVFGARTFSFYGMSEKLVFAAECEESRQLHIEPLYGVVELVDASGTPIESPGVLGEIVATGLISAATGFVRYRTGDIACWAEPHPCPCGRAHRRLERVEGRAYEYLVTRAGAQVSITALVGAIHDDATADVVRFQFVQHEPGSARVLIQTTGGSAAKVPQAFVSTLRRKLGDSITLEPEVVERIPLTRGGKHRYVVRAW